MFGFTFYYNIFLMSGVITGFHHMLTGWGIQSHIYEKFGINMMRSLVCGTIAHEAYRNYQYIWLDKCLENDAIVLRLQEYQDMFMAYFVFDTVLLWYQVYTRIEKTMRIDLFLHHVLGITALMIIDYYRLYGVTLMIGLSEGMSFVTGPKLISMHYGNKRLTNAFIVFRLAYLVFVRMLFIWPTVIYFYNNVTTTCDRYKEGRNMPLVVFMVLLIFHAEIGWFYSGRKELARI